uniref:Putative secreted metalloprotease n=1 Tax=Ixodes ricinus TaxID=34613 RepID=A0A6B0VET7_IXORI
MLEVYRLAFLCTIFYVNVNCAPFSENIVYPKLLNARGINGQKVLHIKDGLTLTLEKLSVLADSLVFTESNDGVAPETIMNGTELEENLFQERKKMAAVAVEDIDGTIQVMGVISETMRIAPLPAMARSEDGHIAHKIYKMERSITQCENDADTVPEGTTTCKRHGSAVFANVVPDEFFVEVHMMVDKYHYRPFQERHQLVKYLALNLALVNMRFEDTSNPKIQFLLTSVKVEPNFAVTYQDKDFVWPISNRTYAHANLTFYTLLDKYGKSPADITVAVTGLNLADYYSYGRTSTAVEGQARLGGVCNANYSMVMVEDVPLSFGMVSRLPHELGHALGAPHDGLTFTWNECLPPRNDCSKNSNIGNFIMHPSKPGNGKFSNCSKAHMSAFISTLTASCFNLKAVQNCTTEMKELPGASVNLTEICKRAHPNLLELYLDRADYLNRSCLFGCCSDSPYGKTCKDEPLPDGAECGGKKRCVRGNCGNYDKYGTLLKSPPGA